MIDREIIKSLKVIWNYMTLNLPIEKSDLIIGCGCANLEIPNRCVELFKQGYANKSEAEIFKDIAIQKGISPNDIYIENKSTNTGDNFRFSIKVIEENQIKADKIIIVHNKLSERRTLSAAKAIIKDKNLTITSPNETFDEFISKVEQRQYGDIEDIISVIVGDIQRMIIFPQFGWQIENDIPKEVLDNYYFLKSKSYNKFIFDKKEIQKLIDKFGLIIEKANYFN